MTYAFGVGAPLVGAHVAGSYLIWGVLGLQGAHKGRPYGNGGRWELAANVTNRVTSYTDSDISEESIQRREMLMPKLEGKTALVTGSGRNIGRAVALKLASEGANVVVNARFNREEAESVADEVRALGVGALPVLADVADREQVEAMFAAAAERFGQVDVLVSNAAIRPHKPFTELTPDDWERVRGVVLDGAFYCARNAIPTMQANGYGRIVFLTGDGAWNGSAERSHVSAAKMGVVGLARGLASEFAPSNIRVNVVSPGRIDTSRDLAWYPGQNMADTSEIPLGRLGHVNDIAAAVAFLATDDCGFITGQTIHVNGGTAYF